MFFIPLIRRSDPINRVREYHPTLILLPTKMIYISFDLCETEVCFLQIHLFGTNVCLPKTHNVPPDVDYYPRNLPQNQSLETVPICIVCSISHTTMFVFTRMMNIWNQSIEAFVTSFGPFRNRSCKCSQTKEFVQKESVSEQFESILLTILLQIAIPLWSGGHRCMGLDTLYSWWVVLFPNWQYRSTHFFAWPTTS